MRPEVFLCVEGNVLTGNGSLKHIYLVLDVVESPPTLKVASL